MKCIHCGEEMVSKAVKSVEIDICADCGGTWFDGDELKELTGYDITAGSVLICLRCEKPMQTKMVRGVEIDICPDCSSIWLDGGELMKLAELDYRASESLVRSTERVLACLRCEKPMQTKMVRDVEIDVCIECTSIWLDGGELKKLSGLDYQAGRILYCPKCDNQLQTKMLRGVEVDVCPKCSGVYLDKGEMEKLSAIEPLVGDKTDISQFLHDAYNQRVKLAIKSYDDGRYDKGKAAEVVGMSLRQFGDLLENRQGGAILG